MPKITRTINMSADKLGLSFDGKRYSWSDLRDEEGRSFSLEHANETVWSLNFEGAKIDFFIGFDVKSMEDLADSFNTHHDGKIAYTWKTEYVGETEEAGVTADVIKNIRMSKEMADKLASASDLKYIVKADETKGIWIEDKNGNKISNSEKTWADLGITSWDSGFDINSTFTYEYKDSVDGAEFGFDFKLSDITSIDSVIDGLNGMEINGESIKTDYETALNVKQDNNLLKVTLSSKNEIFYEEEKALGRDFKEAVTEVAKENITYDAANHKAELVFGNNVISYKADTTDLEQQMKDDVTNYLSFIEKKKIDMLLSGVDPSTADWTIGNLTELLNKNGDGHITTSGYFDKVITLDDTMVKTDGNNYYDSGQSGKKYPAAYIDFSGLGQDYQLSDLEGLGFNSTCKTCSNHYSVIFTSGLSGADETDDNGYAYKFKKQGNQDYLLQIDLDSLRDKGVTDGKGLSEAIVEIASEAYDFHYTQYAAKDGTLYVYDDRESDSGAREATFDTAPYYSIDTDVYDISLKNDGSDRHLDLSYVYRIEDAKDSIKVEMKQASDGKYVEQKSPDGSTTSYVLYDAANYPDPNNQPQRFDVEVSYQNAAGGGAAGTLEEAIDSYVGKAVEKMLTESEIQLNAKDYTYMDISGTNNQNVAIRAEYDSEFSETPYDNGMDIQCSGRRKDKITIPRFPMNTLVLNLYRGGTKTLEQAQKTIEYADYALKHLTSKQGLYGAYQNRLEIAYGINQNNEENITSSESKIRDTDMAAEMVNYSRHNILGKMGESILAQANQLPQGILQLLQ